jgi:hypothetical protein
MNIVPNLGQVQSRPIPTRQRWRPFPTTPSVKISTPTAAEPRAKLPRRYIGPWGYMRREGRGVRAIIRMFHGTIRTMIWNRPRYFRQLTSDEVSLQFIEVCPRLDTAARYFILFMLPILVGSSSGGDRR